MLPIYTSPSFEMLLCKQIRHHPAIHSFGVAAIFKTRLSKNTCRASSSSTDSQEKMDQHYKHGLRSLSKGTHYPLALQQEGPVSHIIPCRFWTACKWHLLLDEKHGTNDASSVTEHNPRGCMQETMKRLGTIETAEMPGKSAFVKPYTIFYELVSFNLHVPLLMAM